MYDCKIALDISSSSTGFAIYGNEKLIESGVFQPKGETAKERFPEMSGYIIDILQKWKPRKIIVEGFYFAKSFASIEYLIKLHGVVECWAARKYISFCVLQPTVWRKALGFPTDKGKIGRKKRKEAAILFAENILGRSPSCDDEADAICIGYADWIMTNSKCLENYA